MRTPNVDVYACFVNFVSQPRAEQANIAHLPLQYSKFADIALEDDSKELPAHSQGNLAIKLEEGGVLPYQPLYGLFKAKLVVLRKYLNNFIAKE
jgi:hypothetical protein